MNVRLLRRIAKVIQLPENKGQFDINSWHRDKKGGAFQQSTPALCDIPKERQISCTTTHCIAGWAQVLSPKRNCKEQAYYDAMRLLEIGYFDAKKLFHAQNWPSGFGGSRATPAQAAARIEHFIKTKGKE